MKKVHLFHTNIYMVISPRPFFWFRAHMAFSTFFGPVFGAVFHRRFGGGLEPRFGGGSGGGQISSRKPDLGKT